MALYLELNVSSQGGSIEEARRMLQEAFMEYLSHMEEEKREDEIRTVPLDVLREFLVEDVEHIRPSHDWIYSENISFLLAVALSLSGRKGEKVEIPVLQREEVSAFKPQEKAFQVA